MTGSAGKPLTTMTVHDQAGNVVAAIEIFPVDPGLAEQLDVFRSARDTTADLAAVGRAIAETCGQIVGSIRSQLAQLTPDDLELTFGVKIAGEAGLPLITKASAEATIEVKATWHRQPIATEPAAAVMP